MRLRRAHFLAALNVAGWAVFAAVFSALFESPYMSRTVRAVEIICLGIIITSGMRRLYVITGTAQKPVLLRVLTACGASAAASLIWWAIVLVIIPWVTVKPLPAGWILTDVVAELVFAAVPLLGWSFLYFTVEDWLAWSDEEQRLNRASALAQTAQLQMLRYQLNPHFLFNALNSIRALIDEDASKARQMIDELSDFLNYSLHIERCSDVPLRVELQALDYYFAIQKKRYEDKLEVSFEIDAGAREAQVLNFLIHPLVENAVKFGMSTSPMPLRIRIAAKRDGDDLVVTVSNTGHWVSPSGGAGLAGTSTGLENVKKRLENAYPGRTDFQSFESDGWVHVKLQIPVLSGASHEIAAQSSGSR